MPIEASVGTLDVENATLRASGLVATTNLAVGRPALKDLNPPTLEIFSEGVPSLELHSNTLNLANSSNAFARFTASAETLVIQSGTDTANDSKGDIAFSGVNDVTRYMTIKGSTGRVGIGTTIPGYLLDVKSTSDDADVSMARIYSDPNASGVSSTGLRIEKGTGYGGIVKGFISQGVGSGLSLHTLNGGTDVQAMTIMNSGDVGIGKTNPLIQFDVGKNGENTRIGRTTTGSIHSPDKRNQVRIGRFDEYESIGDDAFLGMRLMVDTAANLGMSGYYDNQTAIQFYTWGNNVANSREVMRINSIGNVGIGTTNPVAKLILNAYGDESSTDCFIIGTNTASQNLRLGVNSVDQYCWIQSHAGKPLRLNPGGNTIQYGTANNTLSDDRIKDNEVYIENATDTLLKLKPQVYDKKLIWNISKLGETSNTSIVRESGLITQDVWYDAPELRHLVQLGEGAEPGDDKPYTDNDPTNDPDYSSWGDNVSLLDYTGLIPYLIKSNQELHTELQTVKARLDTLENA